MRKNLKVSVITPSFNQGQFLEETILSVLKQNYANIEYIIIDGGSTDGSVDIIRKYEDKLAYWVSEKDEGQTDAINKGLKKATGDILAYLNSDDVYTPSAIEAIVDFFEVNPDILMVYGDIININEHSEPKQRVNPGNIDFYRLLSGRFYLPQPSVFFRREVIDIIGYFDKDLHLAMDLDYWVRILTSKCEIAYLSRVIAKVRFYPNAKSSALKCGYMKEKLWILDKLFSNGKLSKDIVERKRQLYGEVYFDGALNFLRSRQLFKTLQYLIKAILLCPRCFFEPEFLKSVVLAIYGKIGSFNSLACKNMFNKH